MKIAGIEMDSSDGSSNSDESTGDSEEGFDRDSEKESAQDSEEGSNQESEREFFDESGEVPEEYMEDRNWWDPLSDSD